MKSACNTILKTVFQKILNKGQNGREYDRARYFLIPVNLEINIEKIQLNSLLEVLQ